MTIAPDRFCINRKIAPNLDLEQFFSLVKKCGLNKVELRNDMPSGKVTDNLSNDQLNALAEKYGIEIVTINALGMFNLLDDQAALLKNAEALLSQAQAIRSKALVLCPHCSAGDNRSEEQKKPTRWRPLSCWLRCSGNTVYRAMWSRWGSVSAHCAHRC